MQTPCRLVYWDKTRRKYDNDWKTHRERTKDLIVARGQVFNTILGQCEQKLKDKMQTDKVHDYIMQSSDPLLLLGLIEKTVLAEGDNKYQPKRIQTCLKAFLGFQQNELSNADYHRDFLTRVEVARGMGITFGFTSVYEYIATKITNKSTLP